MLRQPVLAQRVAWRPSLADLRFNNADAPPQALRMETMPNKWDSYFANVNGELASLFVDLGIRDKSPDPGRPHLVWCWVYMNQPREDGLSSADEAQTLWTIEEDITASVRGKATFVGRITTAGRREILLLYGCP